MTGRELRGDDRPSVVILGGGFAGVAAARELANTHAFVTVVDQHPYSTFQPLLYQVATGGLNPGDVIYPLRSITARARNEKLVRGKVVGLDTATKKLTLDDDRVLDYDYLILANGATTNYFGVPGAREHSFPLYSRGEALKLRDGVFGGLEKAVAQDPHPDFLRLVVVGGGATGVEMAGALAELRVAEGTAFPELTNTETSVVLIEQGPDLLTAFVPKLRRYARKQLLRRGVEVRTDTAVKEVREDGVVIGDGTFLPANVVIWAAGVAIDTTLADWGLPRGRGGRVLVDENLEVEGLPGVYATGDVSIAKDPSEQVPQLAQPAIQTGRHSAIQIRRELIGQPKLPFHYKDKGTMATIGRRAAVADIAHGPRLTGTLAWLAWLGLHIVLLLGGRNRFAALVNLAARYAAWPRSMNPIIGD
ncbi:MAG TPA: NAD(P)/FAD-dependent oxidoreductase [Actinopolymorphaceae bacterium]|jgi:NADH dehydrogenase